jgi:hypothetical protein
MRLTTLSLLVVVFIAALMLHNTGFFLINLIIFYNYFIDANKEKDKKDKNNISTTGNMSKAIKGVKAVSNSLSDKAKDLYHKSGNYIKSKGQKGNKAGKPKAMYKDNVNDNGDEII